MRTDRELLELAAKAAGVGPVLSYDGHNLVIGPRSNVRLWNPLGEDGQALRLAVDLQMDILQDERSISIKKWCQVRCESVFLAEQQIEERRSVDTRRAIVRAAADIGAAM